MESTAQMDVVFVEGVIIESPLFLLSTKQACNLCAKENLVAAIATQHLVDEEIEPEEDDGFLLCYIEEMPSVLMAEVLKLHPNFELRDSLTAGQTYWMSTCECGGHYGDHYVQKNLFSKIAYEPETVTAQRLNFEGKLTLPCGYSQGSATGEFLAKLI
jgi:hypothetical protein